MSRDLNDNATRRGWYSICLAFPPDRNPDATCVQPAHSHVENAEGGCVVPRGDLAASRRRAPRVVPQQPSAGTSRLQRLERRAALERSAPGAELGGRLAPFDRLVRVDRDRGLEPQVTLRNDLPTHLHGPAGGERSC